MEAPQGLLPPRWPLNITCPGFNKSRELKALVGGGWRWDGKSWGAIPEPRQQGESLCWGYEGPEEETGFGGSEHHLNWNPICSVQSDGEQPAEQLKAKWLQGTGVLGQARCSRSREGCWWSRAVEQRSCQETAALLKPLLSRGVWRDTAGWRIAPDGVDKSGLALCWQLDAWWL